MRAAVDALVVDGVIRTRSPAARLAVVAAERSLVTDADPSGVKVVEAPDRSVMVMADEVTSLTTPRSPGANAPARSRAAFAWCDEADAFEEWWGEALATLATPTPVARAPTARAAERPARPVNLLFVVRYMGGDLPFAARGTSRPDHPDEAVCTCAAEGLRTPYILRDFPERA